RAWIGWTIVEISKITTGDHSKRTDGRERARLRAAQCVFTVAVAHDLSLHAAGQVDTARERLTRIDRVVWRLTIPIGPARIVIAWIEVEHAELPRIIPAA